MVKVGGRLVEDVAAARGFARALSEAGAREAEDTTSAGATFVVVHGGGSEISALGRRLGVEPTFHEGQRVTDRATMRLVSMTLSGEVNKRIVRALTATAVAAVGLSGEDGASVQATPRRGGELGRVGDVACVRPRLLRALLTAGFVPVLSPVSGSGDGEPLNVNADAVAAAVATALGAARLLFLSDVPFVRDGAGRAVATLDEAGAKTLVSEGTVAGGMIPKLTTAAKAASGGIPDVRIGGLTALGGGGTRIVGGAPPTSCADRPASAAGGGVGTPSLEVLA